MTIKDYLQNILTNQDLSEQQEKDLQSHKKEVTDFLRKELGDDPVIKYAGSREKGTMIKDHYDLDIVCYFPSSDTRPLKDIRNDVADKLSQEYLLTHKASAERILDLKGSEAPVDFHIDVVPGRFIEDTDDVFLHVAYGEKERLQTNLKVHIDHIKNSDCVPIIRLVKLWAFRNNINIKTFVLELFVVKTLSDYENKDDLRKSFIKILEEFKDRFTSTQLVDPANSNNIVSQLITDSDKTLVAESAKRTFDNLADSEDINKWKDAFKDNDTDSKSSTTKAPGIAYVAGNSFQPNKPWSGNYD